MTADTDEQEDELLALSSIYGSEEFVRHESKSAGDIRVSVELPSGFNVVLKEGETLRQYEISFLPPLHLTFDLPEDYPSSSPPSFTLNCSWLTNTQLSALSAQLTDLYQATGGAVVLFAWIQFLKEDALSFLDIHTLLELPSEEHSTRDPSQDSLRVEPSELKNNQHTEESEADQHNSSSRHSKVSQDDSEQTSQVVDARKTEETTQTSELKPDHQNVSSAACKSKPSAAAQSKGFDQEGFGNGGSASASWLPFSSSGPPDENEQGAASLPIHARESRQSESQTLSGLSLTPSQTLLSQLLIYDAAQQQKRFAATVFDCGVCFVGVLGSDCVQLPECGHIFCQACLAQLCKLQITEGNVRGVSCPQADCTATPTPAQVKSLVGEELFTRYDRLLLQNTLDCMPDVVYCPRLSCGSAVIKSSTAAMCSVCSFAFCVACRKTYHGTDDCQEKRSVKPQTGKGARQATVDLPQSQEGIKALWDDYASGSKQRQHLLESRYSREMLQFTVVECLSEDWMAFNSKNCPHCFSRIQKDRGCNIMTCSRCRKQFCWACLTRLPITHIYKHFEDGPCSLYQYYPRSSSATQ